MERITIPKPCHEKWNEMSSEEKGRHCAVCNKTVIDFTHSSLPEIHQFLQDNSESKVCGRFNFEHVEHSVKTKNWFQKKAIDLHYFIGKKQFSGFAASFSMLLLFLVGCKKEITGDIAILNDSTVSIKDSMNDIEMGEALAIKDTSNCATLDSKKQNNKIQKPNEIIEPKIVEIPPIPPMGMPIIPKDSLNKTN